MTRGNIFTKQTRSYRWKNFCILIKVFVCFFILKNMLELSTVPCWLYWFPKSTIMTEIWDDELMKLLWHLFICNDVVLRNQNLTRSLLHNDTREIIMVYFSDNFMYNMRYVSAFMRSTSEFQKLSEVYIIKGLYSAA